MNYELQDWNSFFGSEFDVIPVYDNGYTKEICICLPKGETMQKHKAPADILVQVIRGEIDFGVDGDIVNMKQGFSIKLPANIEHDLFAKEDSLIRLTLNKNDTFLRVKSVKLAK